MNSSSGDRGLRVWLGASVLLAALLPAAGFAASLSLDKEPVVLGRSASVEVTLRVAEEEHSEDLPLRLSVNVGSFGEVTRLEPGVYKAIYTPPATRFPQVALVAAWRETGPEAPIEFLRIPLYGTSRIDTVAPAGSEVRVLVGASEFGPVATNALGKASVPIDVPPGVPEATIVVREKSGQTVRRTASISVPPYNRLTVALVPHAILANGQDWARLEVFYDSPTPVPAENVSLTASEGSATPLGGSPGRYAFKYLPPAGSLSREATFEVGVEDDPHAKGKVSLGLGMPPPAEITLTPPARSVLADGHASAPVQVRVFDDRRLGLPHQRIEVTANGKLVPEITYKGDGLYEARLVAPASYPEDGLVRLAATVVKPDGRGLTATGLYRVLPVPLPASATARVAPPLLLADGESKASVTLDVKDKAGQPLAGARLLATASHGAAGNVLELGEGRYRVEFMAPEGLPPNDEALVRIVDASGSFEKVVPIALRKEQRLLVGGRGGFTHSLKDLSGPRAGLDLFAPFRLSSANLALEATAVLGGASQRVEATTGSSSSSAIFVPASLRLAWAPLVTSDVAVWIGAGAVATWARVRNDANGYDATKTGFGALGFAAAALELGPGQAFLEASWTWCPVEHDDFRLDAGGVGAEIGYRFGLF